MRKTILRAGLAAGLTAAAGSASATPCDLATSSYASYVSSGDLYYAGYVLSNHPECFGGGPASSLISIHNTSFFLFHAITHAMLMRQAAEGPVPMSSLGLKGMSAGASSGASKWSVWGNLGTNNTRQSYTSVGGTNIKNNTEVATLVFGADYGLSSSTVLGISGALDDGDGVGKNAGVAGSAVSTNGYVIAPYVGMQLSRTLSFDASVGLGRGNLDTSGNTSANADRWFAAANLSYSRWFDRLQLTGKASLLHGVEDYGDIKAAGTSQPGTDARNTIDQLKLSGQIGYWMNGVMPVASLAYTNDMRRKTTQFGAPNNPIGRDGWLMGIGLNFYSVKDGVTGGIVYNREFGRGNQNQEGLMANINLRF
ncbi:MAG: hypothetical protein EFKGCFLK_00043 [Rhodocyclaceae bacterium]|nr:MAG: autotransporter outer membrane beta-barrel domain-containing protein [Rhodocyclaceae bacterium]MBV6406498.1 hypothetical protein [Rhodocyclaceae bacterium]CAG0930169.1 hypothetical protein RHDC3_01409 [Rhodocyclaceae bacterium]